eukprot:GHVU01131933.1.p1 GENE.GHVU01131933.1~~GHVU01131933.1.p1  ORF type:complete len:120 (-),score=23.79 GHVU01131933.1:266-625(-)
MTPVLQLAKKHGIADRRVDEESFWEKATGAIDLVQWHKENAMWEVNGLVHYVYEIRERAACVTQDITATLNEVRRQAAEKEEKDEEGTEGKENEREGKGTNYPALVNQIDLQINAKGVN